MVGRRWWAVQSRKWVQRTLAIGLAIQILSGNGSALAASLATTGQLSETAPPKTFLDLSRVLDQYQPQIKIISPKAGQLLSDNGVTVSFQLQDLPIYKDKTLGLGPHLHLVVDDQPHQSIYDANEPIVLKDLEPGTHTVRIFAASPWDEAFKNDGSFAQVTFDVFTKTDDNSPQVQKPLLTYNQPQGTYGAEPILLDFYVTDAPLHLIAQESDTDSVQDWKVKATVNGQSFLLDRWQPIYLKGFKPGKNWVQLEFINEKGDRVENFGNNTARIFNYEPGGQGSLAQLTRGEISIDQAKGIVDPTYTPPAPPKPIEPNVPAVKSTKPIDIPDPVKLVPNTSKILTPVPIVPSIPIAPIPKAQESGPSIVPSAEPVKPIEIKPDLNVQKPSVTSTPEKQTRPNSASRRTVQEKLPSFIGPGKKIEVKIPIVAPVTAPVVVKAEPVEPNVPATDADAPKITADAPKTGNWFDRFRKSDPAPDLTVKDSMVKTDDPTISNPLPSSSSQTNSVPAPPIVPPKPNRMSSPPVLELTKDQKIELSTQKKSAIETRKPFNLFGSGEKAEVTPTEAVKADLKPDAIVKPEPKVITPEAVIPENQAKPKEPKSIAEEDSMKSLVDRLNEIPTPTKLKTPPTPTEASMTGDELFNQLKSKINPPKPTLDTPPIEMPASETAG